MECMHHAMFYGRFLKQGIAKSKWISLPMAIKKEFQDFCPRKTKAKLNAFLAKELSASDDSLC